MSVFKSEKTVKSVILVNSSAIDYKFMNGKNLVAIDKIMDLQAIELGESTNPKTGDVYTSLILETKDNFLAVPLSKAITEDLSVLEDRDTLKRCVFQMRNKKGANDVEGNYAEYTGASYISFGLPAEITFTKRTIAAAEPTPAVKETK